MNKVTYKMSGLFSLKKYDDSNLNCRSYEYMTTYGTRSAILGAVIETEGPKKAQELFNKIKNAIIYIQVPSEYKRNGVPLKRARNSFYSGKEASNPNDFATMGYREFIDVDEMVFYIDNSIPDIEMYLKNIDFWGNSEGLAYLHDFSSVTKLENVLLEWDKKEDVEIFENWDWSSKMEFENVYFFGDGKRLKKQSRIYSKISNIEI